MSATTATATLDLRALASAFAPGTYNFDPLGLVSGYKAYLIFTGLDASSDAELGRMGLARADLPRAAMEAAKVLQRA